MNKFLKIVIGLLLMIFVIFVGAGIFVPEVKYQTTISIDRPLGEVWEKFNDPHMMAEWMSDVQDVRVIRDVPEVIGSQYLVVVGSQGKPVEIIETVTEFLPQKRVSISMEIDDMFKTSAFEFSETAGGVLIVADHTCRGQSFVFKCIFAFFKGMFKAVDNETMKNLKSWIEG